MIARLAFLLLLIAPPIALAADAPSAGGGRIAVVAQPAPKAAEARPAAPMSPLPVSTQPASADASSCRMDCAQSYYACRSDQTGGDCGGPWSQCVATCNNPNLAPPTTTSP
ncbi:MAG TPA: hypothetical protein VG248_14465 [Caulobacteraceae bacterium]|nr:hypothetical protein [Caulobacteraceae bacterium]